ncbi:MAG: class I SAM-dependent methyltransferase [Verrucomicrobiota bacterium]
MPRELAISGTHAFVMKVLNEAISSPGSTRVLDIGAGQGALSVRLVAAGYQVDACDYVPEQFDVEGITCRRCDDTGILPFEDEPFDLAVAVEVLEHIDGHEGFFREAARVLKPGGRLLFTTPNILSLKSRLRFLFTGFFYSFDPLEPFTRDPVSQHIAPFSLNRYAWMLSQQDLTVEKVLTDKTQRSSIFLSCLIPFIRLCSRLRYGENPHAKAQNSVTVLLGRKLVIIARKAL